MAAGASSSSLAVVGPAAAMVAASYCRPSAGAAHTLAGRSTRWAAGCCSSRCLRSSSHQTTSGPPEKQRRLRKIRVCTKWATRATTPAGATYDNNQYKVTHEQRKIEHATGIGCSSDDATHLWLAGTIGLHKFHHEVVVARDQQLLLRLSIACNTHGSTSCSALFVSLALKADRCSRFLTCKVAIAGAVIMIRVKVTHRELTCA